MSLRLGVVEDLAHLRRHVELREEDRVRALRRFNRILTANLHRRLDRQLDGRVDDDEEDRVDAEIDLLAELLGVQTRNGPGRGD